MEKEYERNKEGGEKSDKKLGEVSARFPLMKKKRWKRGDPDPGD